PSTLKAEVGPNVLSLAGLPASPRAPAVPINTDIAIGEKPAATHIGTYSAAIRGIVPKEEPIPSVITKPTSNKISAIIALFSCNIPEDTSIKTSTAPVFFKTLANPEDTNITKAIVP